ncbi:hypothetical protein YPH_4328 [Yersinia pestis biovar Orientalis str. PEXU2]|nr:hypothetical protein YPH_4328 [Yersinia pestis biovar Orientalis str. PEXU2]
MSVFLAFRRLTGTHNNENDTALSSGLGGIIAPRHC